MKDEKKDKEKRTMASVMKAAETLVPNKDFILIAAEKNEDEVLMFSKLKRSVVGAILMETLSQMGQDSPIKGMGSVVIPMDAPDLPHRIGEAIQRAIGGIKDSKGSLDCPCEKCTAVREKNKKKKKLNSQETVTFEKKVQDVFDYCENLFTKEEAAEIALTVGSAKHSQIAMAANYEERAVIHNLRRNITEMADALFIKEESNGDEMMDCINDLFKNHKPPKSNEGE